MDRCKSCNSTDIVNYYFTKCKTCGKTYANFGKFSKEAKLKIIYNSGQDKIYISGNKEGLEFLADCCLSVIGKSDPAGHIHLEWQMNNLLAPSTETILEFSDKPEDGSP